MPEHSLPPGRQLISALETLGSTLGYLAAPEWPLDQGPAPPAVDMVWFTEPEQRIPILMFEVESTPSASLSNNAMKVFGKSRSALQKPLFLFHIVIAGGNESSRVPAAEAVFFSHNYRVYLFGNGEILTFLCDLFDQHRRLRKHLNLMQVIPVIRSDWPTANLTKILEHLEHLRFETRYAQTYALLAGQVSECKERFFEFLLNAEMSHIRSGCDYSLSYLGNAWSRPIHLALLAHQDPDRAGDWFQKLKHWQEEGSFMSMIGPYWGLSRDYDEFIARLSPFLWSLLAALMKSLPSAQSYFCDRIIEILRTVGADHISVFHAVWLLHIASSCGSKKDYDFARNWIDERGGVGRSALLNPPALLTEDNEHAWMKAGRIKNVPREPEFRQLIKLTLGDGQNVANPEDVGINVLVSDVNNDHAESIVRSLALYAI
jgi:hypothetical protein